MTENSHRRTLTFELVAQKGLTSPQMSVSESLNMSYYTPFYENKQKEREIIQWRLLIEHEGACGQAVW